MERTETIKILSVLKAAYPNFYRDMRKQDMEGIVELWATMFSDEDYATVASAVKAHIACDQKGFPPHIGAIKDSIAKLQTKGGISEAEAWGIVRCALRNGIYGAEKEFNRLPPAIKRLVGSPNQLREWAMMDEDELGTVVASNFQRSYRVVEARERDMLKLPSDVRNLMLDVGSAFSLEAAIGDA